MPELTFPPEQVFNLAISALNFGIMFILFKLVVIEPMQEAVVLREKRVTERIAEVDAVLAEAKALHERHTAELEGLEARLAELRQDADDLVGRTVARIEEQAVREAEHVVERAGLEADSLRRRTEHELRQKLAAEALGQARKLLSEHVDKKAKQSMVEHVISKVGTIRAS